jgi:hypothetical protein
MVPRKVFFTSLDTLLLAPLDMLLLPTARSERNISKSSKYNLNIETCNDKV